MGKKSTRTIYRNRVDYTNLLSELNGGKDTMEGEHFVVPDAVGEIFPDVEELVQRTEEKPFAMSMYRQRIMSDQRVRYIYSEKDNVIHDKSCRRTREIDDKDLFYSENYMPQLHQCRECAMRAYIHAGARDYNNYRVYEQLFERLHLWETLARHMYIECGMQTRAYSNVLTIWDREDTWKVEPIDSSGTARLLHNNYHVGKDGSRVFDKGFHVQSEYLSHSGIGAIIHAIETYSFENHRQMVQEQKERMNSYLERVAQEQTDAQKPKTLWQRIKDVFFKSGNAETASETAHNNIAIHLDGFLPVSEVGYPKQGERCVYIWKTRERQPRWQVGMYDRTLRAFVVNYGENKFVTDRNKVIYWKRIDVCEGIQGEEVSEI
jgi:hypothetical protein